MKRTLENVATSIITPILIKNTTMYTRTNTAKWLPKYNRWQIKVQKDGVRRTFTCPVPGRKGQIECNRKADTWLHQGIVNERTRVVDLYESFIKEKSIHVGTSRLNNIRSYFKARIFPYIGRQRVSALTEQDLQDILNDMYLKGYSFHTISDTKSMLVEFIRFARKNNLTTMTPENLFVSKKASRGIKKILQPEDLTILFTEDTTMMYGKIISDPLIHAYRLLVVTGLRRGELLGLKWSDIREHTITIKRSINEYGEVTEGKTENSQRTIPLTDLAQAILDKIPHIDDYVFGREFNPPYLLSRYKVYAEFHDLSARTLHELRHTFISMVDSDMPLNVLKDVVGHSDTMNTVTQYGHVVNGEIEKAGDIINEKFQKWVTNGLKD